MNKSSSLTTVALLLAMCPNSVAQRPTFDGKTVLFGNLHAHSTLSDDTSANDPDRTPLKAFTYAHQHGLDFLGITDHHKATDSSHPLRLTPNEYKMQLFDVAMQYNQDHPQQFIAIPGIEWGTTASGNHLGVYGASSLPPDTILDKGYDQMYVWANANAEFLQCNHPYSWHWKSNRDKNVGNFGEKLYSTSADFVNAVGDRAGTMSIICSVHGGHISGALRDSDKKTHREMHWKHYGVFLGFLNKGFHLSPAANQDTHGKNWGTVTAARTAAWVDTVHYDSLMQAMRANRVYATEDDELAVAFQVELDGVRHWMGETVSLVGTQANVKLIAHITQGPGSDGDPTDEGPYTISIISDPDGIGGHEAAVWHTQTGIPGNQVFAWPITVQNGEYLFLHVTEENGKDNELGDGDDEINNDTGVEQADGKRDDMNDSAWTTPIWFVTADPSFVWSENSVLYHDHDCWVVPIISTANRREGNTAPVGRTKHDCQPHNPFE